MDDVEGAIGGSAVDHDIFNMGIALPEDRLDSFFDSGGAVIDDGDEGDLHVILYIVSFNNNILHNQHIHFCSQETIQGFFWMIHDGFVFVK